MDNRLRVGVITTTHGIKGEVKVFPTTVSRCHTDRNDQQA